jgi:hypothetical protein
MFKNLVRIHLGGWWLLVGIWRKGLPFAVNVRRSCPQEFYLRFLWLEISISELPF